jgi:hypothetical protein
VVNPAQKEVRPPGSSPPDHLASERPRDKRRGRFAAGIVLMAVSFSVYPAYPLILFLPFSGQIKAATMVAASLLSWAVFSAGIFLAGQEGYNWLKGLWKR